MLVNLTEAVGEQRSLSRPLDTAYKKPRGCRKTSSPVNWQHINLHVGFGCYDDLLKDFLCFDNEALLTFIWAHTINPANRLFTELLKAVNRQRCAALQLGS